MTATPQMRDCQKVGNRNSDRKCQSRKVLESLKTLIKKEGIELATNCSQLKLESSDGKYYNTDVADKEQLLRL